MTETAYDKVQSNKETLAEAHRALDEIAAQAVKEHWWGTFGVELIIQDGRLTAVSVKRDTKSMSRRANGRQ